jgi:hypothetical protein
MAGDDPFDAEEERQFKQEFYAAAFQAGLLIKSYEANEAVLNYHGELTRFSLAAMRRRWRAAGPEAREHVVYLQLTAPFEDRFSSAEATLDEVKASLLPRIAPPGYRAERNPTETPPSVPIVEGHLHAHVVVNEPATMWFVSNAHLRRWGASLEDLLAVAVENLRRRTDRKKVSKIDAVEAYLLLSDDSYDAARALVLDTLVDPFPQDGVVVLVPMREVLMFAPVEGPKTREALAHMMELAYTKCRGATFPVSDQVF